MILSDHLEVNSFQDKILLITENENLKADLEMLLKDETYQIYSYKSAESLLVDIQNIKFNFIFWDSNKNQNTLNEFIKLNHPKTKNFPPILFFIEDTIEDTKDNTTERYTTDLFIFHIAKTKLPKTLQKNLKAIRQLTNRLNDPSSDDKTNNISILIKPIRHDLANSLAVIDGMLKILCRKNPNLNEDPSVTKINDSIQKNFEILKKLDQIREQFELIPYGKTKVG